MKTIITIFAILFFANISIAQKGNNIAQLNYVQIKMASQGGSAREPGARIPMTMKEVFSNQIDINNKMYFPLGQAVEMNPALLPIFVDWVKIEIRPENFVRSRTIFLAGILTSNDEVCDPVTTKKFIPFWTQNNVYHIQVTTPNTLTVLSPLQSFTGNVKEWDFTFSLARYFRNSTTEPEPAVLVNGKWCLWSGDASKDNLIDADDTNLWELYKLHPEVGYHPVDQDYNNWCTVSDLLFMKNNMLKITNAPPYP